MNNLTCLAVMLTAPITTFAFNTSVVTTVTHRLSLTSLSLIADFQSHTPRTTLRTSHPVVFSPFSTRSPRFPGKSASSTKLNPLNHFFTMSTISFLDQDTATLVDVRLMGPDYGFSIDALMELAGLAVAQAAADAFPLETTKEIAIVSGPGNNGGDGLVAARHLYHFGYNVSTIYPKRPSRQPFLGLVKQLESLVESDTGNNTSSNLRPRLRFCDEIPSNVDAIIDAIFGFSFKPDPEDGIREPYRSLLEQMGRSKCKVLSVDIPSGWNVNHGKIYDMPCVDNPYALISLTAPKLCTKNYSGIHYVGGRFVPPKLASELNINLPTYPGTQGFVKI